MKTTKTSANRYLIIGLIIFPLGLLILFRQLSFTSLISNIIPASETVDILGAILLFLGEGTIAFGIIGTVTNKVLANADKERMIYANTLTHVMEQQTAVYAAVKSMQDQVAQANTRLQQIQTASTSPHLPKNPINCKFCGANMGDGRFCPNCGRAQT
jgi:hypothetical protein